MLVLRLLANLSTKFFYSFLFLPIRKIPKMPPQESGGGGGGGGDNGMKNQHPNSASVMSKEQKTVCVMDASGSLGSELVKTLLQRGYFVHAALQSHSKGKLQSMKVQCTGDEKQNLKIFHADLLDYHSILDTLSGCSALFYIFEPPFEHPIYDVRCLLMPTRQSYYLLSGKIVLDSIWIGTLQEHMADIEVRAAHNVLEACAQTPTIEKVIFTSSATAVVWTDTRDGASSSCDVDEKSWSDINFCKKFKLWHALSKTLAEKTAWALAMDRGVSMVSVNGGLLLDNNLRKTSATHPDANNSKQSFPSYLKGAAEMYENGVLVAVDLWFLVDTHICIFEEVSSYGRYLCFNHVINCHKDAVKLASMFMSSPPQSSEDTRVYPQRISNKKLNELMVNFDGQFQLH